MLLFIVYIVDVHSLNHPNNLTQKALFTENFSLKTKPDITKMDSVIVLYIYWGHRRDLRAVQPLE